MNRLLRMTQQVFMFICCLFGGRPRPCGRFIGRARTIDKINFMLRRLQLSKIDPKVAKYAGICEMSKQDAVQQARKVASELPEYTSDGMFIPYHGFDGKPTGYFRIRNNPDARKGFAKLTKQPKYSQPKGAGCALYLPRVDNVDWQGVLNDPKKPIFLVEGELKALSLCSAGVVASGIGGDWNWTNKGRLMADLRELAKGGRTIYILFDSDMKDKPQILGAAHALARALLDAGGNPTIIHLPHIPDPESPDKTGADDYRRLNPKLRGESLRDALLSFAEPFPEAIELHRLNSQYVFVEDILRVVRLYDAQGRRLPQRKMWSPWEFSSDIENGLVPIVSRSGRVEETKDVPVGEQWRKWPGRNRVFGQIYKPVSQSEEYSPYTYENKLRYLNLFEEWGSIPKENSQIIADFFTPFFEHLFRCAGTETEEQTKLRLEAMRWCLKWFAYPVQHAGAKQRNAVVLSGHQGGGKDMLGRAVGYAVYGRHYRSIGPRQLQSQFNGYMAGAGFIHAEEVTSKESKYILDSVLKAFITNDLVTINEKNEKAYTTNAHFNLFLTTNPQNSIQIDRDDRRYFVWRIAPVRILQMYGKKWLDDFHRILIGTEEGRAALHFHLLETVSCKGYDPNAEPPITFAKQAAQEYSMSEVESYMARYAEELHKTKPEIVCTFSEEKEKAETALRRTLGQKEFRNAFEQHFRFVTDDFRVPVSTPLGNVEHPQRGLWTLNPTPEQIEAGEFPRAEEVVARYKKQFYENQEKKRKAKFEK